MVLMKPYRSTTVSELCHALTETFLDQNRLMDTGGVTLASVLLKCPSLECLTVSYNFMMEEAAKALLAAAAKAGPALREIYSEGNLFDEA